MNCTDCPHVLDCIGNSSPVRQMMEAFPPPPTRGDSMQDQPLRRCVDVLSEREWPGARRAAGPAALSVLYVDSSQVVRSLRSLGAQQL